MEGNIKIGVEEVKGSFNLDTDKAIDNGIIKQLKSFIDKINAQIHGHQGKL